MTIPVEYQGAVGKGLRYAGLAGVPGAFTFVADVAGLGVVWGGLIFTVARRQGHELDFEVAKGLAGSVLEPVRQVAGGAKLGARLLKWVPGPWTLASIGISAGLNMLYTLRFSEILIDRLAVEEVDWKGFPAAVAEELTGTSWKQLLAGSDEAWNLATSLGNDLPPIEQGAALDDQSVAAALAEA